MALPAAAAAALLLLGCGAAPADADAVADSGEPRVRGPLTHHFSEWIKSHSLDDYYFDRADYVTQGSYGGLADDDDKAVRTPVIFVHGNSDAALRVSPIFSGWEFSILHFLERGYKKSELYATSWGDDDAQNAPKRCLIDVKHNSDTFMTHNCITIRRLRMFIERFMRNEIGSQSVKNYTGAEKIDIVAHSQGVTLSRKAIQGGNITAEDGTCNLGTKLPYISTFVGLSGANYGLCMCQHLELFNRSCNVQNGFWPGNGCGDATVCGSHAVADDTSCDPRTLQYSALLDDINTSGEKEAEYIVSAWSLADELLQNKNYVWGRNTSLIPSSDEHKIYEAFKHLETKEQTTEEQYRWLNRDAVDS